LVFEFVSSFEFRYSDFAWFVRPFSVIPAKAEPALDSIRGIHVHRNETAEDYPEGAKYLRRPSADQNGPRVMARGDGLLKDPGFVRRLFRHAQPMRRH
jgi:hypothetical protein